MAEPALRLQAKVAAVERVLGGARCEDAAHEIGVGPDRLERWVRAYVAAGKEGVRYTADPGEVPSLRGVLGAVQSGFPSYIVGQAQSAAAFFCAEFYGRTDVVHLYRLGLRAVHLIDIDAAKLAAMAGMYPPSWTITTGDAFKVVQDMQNAGQVFDLVTSDAYAADTVAFEWFDTFAAIARQHLVLNFRQRMFDALAISPEASELSAAMTTHRGAATRCVDVARRSTHDGGMYWATFEAKPA